MLWLHDIQKLQNDMGTQSNLTVITTDTAMPYSKIKITSFDYIFDSVFVFISEKLGYNGENLDKKLQKINKQIFI